MRAFCFGVLFAFGGIANLTAQCTPQWLPGAAYPGVNGYVHTAAAWDPDGTGPLPMRLVLGGTFSLAGNLVVANIATFEPTTNTWATLGSGMNNAVLGLAVDANGDLLAVGHFTTAGGVPAAYVARWNGTTWSAIGTGPGSGVTAITTLGGGGLAVTTNAGVSRWDGTAWTSLGPNNGQLLAIAELPNGDLVVGGNFLTMGSVSAHDIARWDGTTWTDLGGGIPGNTSGQVNGLLVESSGDLIVVGDFYSATGPRSVARWNGTTWSSFGSGIGTGYQYVEAAAVLPNGNLLVGGRMTLGSQPTYVAQWDGTAWAPLGDAPSYETVTSLVAFSNTDVFAAGNFSTIDGSVARAVARWTGSAWVAVTPGTNDSVSTLLTMPNGDLVAGGSFLEIEGTPANHVARWNGTVWSALGTGMDGPVFALLALTNGDLIAGGTFATAGGVRANGIARWNGATWSALGTGWQTPPGGVEALVELPNGGIAAGGWLSYPAYPGIVAAATWNGTTWTSLPTTFAAGSVRALEVFSNGDLLLGGSSLSRWDGTSLQTFASANGIQDVDWLPDGRLAACGEFTSIGGVAANRVAVWDGTAWSQLGSGIGNGTVHDLQVLPNGDLVAGGAFTSAGGLPVNNLARWNGVAWSAIGAGVQGTMGYSSAQVWALTMPANGPLLAGGFFFFAGGQASPHLARLDTPCPAVAAGFGTGCSGSGGSNTLTVTSPPWVDSTFRATGTGLPATALVLTLTSVTSIVGGFPLSNAFTQAGPGCNLLVAPDILGVLVTTNGTAVSQLFLPNVPPLVGVTFFHQMVPIELDVLGNWVSVQATNALQLTAGQF
jgi:hypothetical protein